MTVFRAMLAAVLVLAAGAGQAQPIPVPFDDDGATKHVSVTVTPGRTSMRGLPSDLREARRRMHARQVVADAELRALALRGDGLAAQKYVRLLVGRGEIGENPSDIAYFAAIAVGTGRVWTLPDMIEAMHRLDPATEPRDRVRKYIQVLYPHAWNGNALALDAVVAFNGEDRLFGALSDSTRAKILAEARESGAGRVELTMALRILERGEIDPEAQHEARGLLRQAQGASHLGVRVTAGNLLALMDEKYGAGD